MSDRFAARGLRVCVCTSYRADAEPRAPRHAKAIAALDEVADVVLLECVPYGELRSELPDLMDHPKLRSTVHWYAHRNDRPFTALLGKVLQKLALHRHAITGGISPFALSSRATLA